MRRFLSSAFFGTLALLFAAPISARAKSHEHDIADTLNNTRILNQFAVCVQHAELGTFLSSRGPFTVFAPTDSAFSRLAPATLESLLQPENKEELQRIVLYHIFSGKSNSAHDLQTITSLISCEGLPWKIKMSRTGAQTIQKARLVHADIHCLNGIIHEIDTLLIPADAPLDAIAADAATAEPAGAVTAPTPTPSDATAPPPEKNPAPPASAAHDGG